MSAVSIKQLPKGPKYPSWVQFILYARNTASFLDRMRGKFGPTFTLRFPFQPPVVILSRREDVASLMALDSSIAPTYPANDLIESVFGSQSLLFMSDRSHADQRRLLKPHFSPQAATNSSQSLSDSAVEYVNKYSVCAEANESSSLSVNVLDWSMHFVLKTSIEQFLGIRDKNTMQELIAAIEMARVRYSSYINMALDSAAFGQQRQGLTTVFAQLLAGSQRNALALKFKNVLTRHAETLLIDLDSAPRTPFSDFLRQLKQNNIPLEDSGFVDFALTLLIAGYDPPTIIISRMLLILASDRELQNRIRSEVLADDGCAELDSCIYETIRLFPPLYASPRSILVNKKIGEVDYPAGTRFFACMYLMHRDGDSWKDADQFDTARFSASVKLPDVDQGFMPFGGNKHVCPGQHHAPVIIREFIKAVIGCFKLEELDAHAAMLKPHNSGPTLINKPSDRIKLKLL